MRSKHGGDCLNRVHYKCGCTQEATDAAPDRSYDDHGRTKNFRYSNKVGFDIGLIFPIATNTDTSLHSNSKMMMQ